MQNARLLEGGSVVNREATCKVKMAITMAIADCTRLSAQQGFQALCMNSTPGKSCLHEERLNERSVAGH